MGLDITTLALAVDSSGVRRSTDDMQKWERQGQRVEGQATRVEGKTQELDKSFRSLQRTMAALGIAAMTTQFIRMADQYTMMVSRLSLVTEGTEALARTQEKLMKLAQGTRADLQATTDLYATLARSTKELRLNEDELIKVTGTLNKALVISGASTQAANAAIVQFNQAMAAGVLRGEEFNSVSEQAPRVMQILSDSLGKTRGELRQLAQEGKLTSDVVLPAIMRGARRVDAEFAKMDMTVGQAGTNIKNSLLAMVGAMDQSVGSTRALAGIFGDLSKIMDAVTEGIDKHNEAAREAGLLQKTFGVVFETVAVLGTELAFVFKAIGLEIGAWMAQLAAVARFDFAGSDAIRDMALEDARALRAETDATINRIMTARHVSQQARTEAMADADAFIAAGEREAVVVGMIALANQKGAQSAKELADAMKRAADATKQYNDLIQGMNASDGGFDTDFHENLQLIQSEALKAGKSFEVMREELLRYIQTQEFYKRAEQEALQIAQARQTQRQAEAAGIRDYMRAETERLRQAVRGSRDVLKAAKDEYDAYGLTRSQIAEVTLARLEDQLVAVRAGTEIHDSLAEQIRLQRELVDVLRSGERRDQWAAAEQERLAESVRINEQIAQSFVDSLMQGGKSVVQYLKDLFRTLVLRPMLQPIAGGMAGLFGGGSAMAGQAGGGGMIGNGSSLLGLGGGMGSIGAGFMNGLSAWGAGGSVTGVLSNPGLYTIPELAGALAPIVLGIAALAAAFGAFRRTRTVGTGLMGTLGEGDISNYELTRRSGYLFGGPSYRLHDRGVAEGSEGIQLAYGQMREATAQMAEMIGLSTADAVRAFTMEIGSEIHPDTGGLGLALEGLSESEAQQAFADMLSGANEALAELALGTTEYTREGELASQTLQRLSSSLVIVNDMFTDLGHQMFDVSLAGADMASMLADAFGGLENLTQGLGQYYQLFYSEEERAANITRRMTQEFERFGATVPDTMETYRAMVESLDLSTEAGREFYEVMIRYAPAFAGLRDAATEALDDIVETVRQAHNINTPISSIKEWQQPIDNSGPLAALHERLRALQALSNGAERALQSLLPTSAAAERMRTQQALAKVMTANAIGRAGGSLAGMNLDEAFRSLSGIDAGAYGSSFEFARDQARATAELELLRELTGEQITDTQRQINLLQDIADNTAGLKGPGTLITKGIPAFAGGGMHSGGLAMVGEHGPELVSMGPARVYSAGQTAGMLDNSQVVAELRAMRRDLEVVKGNTQATAQHTARTAKYTERSEKHLEAFDAIGIPLRD